MTSRVIRKLSESGVDRPIATIWHPEAKGEKSGLPELDENLEITSRRRLLSTTTAAVEDVCLLGRRYCQDFRHPRPRLQTGMDHYLEYVVRNPRQNRWPGRMHATYDETNLAGPRCNSRVNQEHCSSGLNWFLRPAETIVGTIDRRSAAPRRGLAVRIPPPLAWHIRGEYSRAPGFGLPRPTPPIARHPQCGVKVSAGTMRRAGRLPTIRGYRLAWRCLPARPCRLRLYPPPLPRPRNGTADVTRRMSLVLDEEGRKAAQVGALADLIAPTGTDIFPHARRRRSR